MSLHQVLSNQTVGGYITESAPVDIHTFEAPDDLDLWSATNTSLTIAWRSPSDGATLRATIHHQQVRKTWPYS